MIAAQVFGAEMRIKAVSKDQLRKVGLPLGASVIAAAGTMFVPTALLEMITGATGLSELVPATAAPLGDTARALIAFGTGALTLAAASLVTLRGASFKATPRTDSTAPMTDRMDNMQTKPSLADRIGSFRMPHIKLPKMPWIKGEGDVTELSDLPRIRTADAHPDAPSRRPLVATEDLPTLELTNAQARPVVVGNGPVETVQVDPVPAIDPAKWYGEIAASTAPDHEAAPLPSVVEPVAEVAPLPLPISEPVPAPVVIEAPVAPVVIEQPVAASLTQLSLDDMLAQFEASIARRHAQIATNAAESAPVAASETVESEFAEPVQSEILPPVEHEPVVEPQPARFATPLTAIPNANKAAEEMDSALAAALATLQRMNGTSR